MTCWLDIFNKSTIFKTTARNGLSESELEDILSCDDDVLNDVYQFWKPPLRRLPPLLMARLRTDLQQYLGIFLYSLYFLLKHLVLRSTCRASKVKEGVNLPQNSDKGIPKKFDASTEKEGLGRSRVKSYRRNILT